MIAHFKHPAAMVPGSSMPAIQLSDAQLNALAAFLLKLTPHNAEALANAPDFAVKAALLYQSKNCGSCHEVNGVGMKIGPPLNGLARRRTKRLGGAALRRSGSAVARQLHAALPFFAAGDG
jgi:ubiquinol-cytochrome c reductase cytochrome b subunit